MTVLGIRIVGDPILRTRADEVTEFGPVLRKLVADMDETMENVEGAGLAAPQVGVSRIWHVSRAQADRCTVL